VPEPESARGAGGDAVPFISLDFLYVPSRDVSSDRDYFVATLGARCVFAIEAWNTRVAMLALAGHGPHLLLTDHVDGDAPILIYRAANLDATLERMSDSGWERQATFEIPHGPCCSFRTPGGQRLAVYEVIRPRVDAEFVGRFDF
jgi:hypothetical protein